MPQPQPLSHCPLKPSNSVDEPRVLQPFATSFEHIGQVLAALGTHCFIPHLPTPTQQLKQALRATTQDEQPIGETSNHESY